MIWRISENASASLDDARIVAVMGLPPKDPNDHDDANEQDDDEQDDEDDEDDEDELEEEPAVIRDDE